jgi:hypothetical protein
MPDRPVCVLAPSFSEAQRWADRRGWCADTWQYVRDDADLRVRPDLIIAVIGYGPWPWWLDAARRVAEYLVATGRATWWEPDHSS